MPLAPAVAPGLLRKPAAARTEPLTAAASIRADNQPQDSPEPVIQHLQLLLLLKRTGFSSTLVSLPALQGGFKGR